MVMSELFSSLVDDDEDRPRQLHLYHLDLNALLPTSLFSFCANPHPLTKNTTFRGLVFEL